MTDESSSNNDDLVKRGKNLYQIQKFDESAIQIKVSKNN